jgi:hypothetical protein
MNGISANVTSNEQDLYFNTICQILRKSELFSDTSKSVCILHLAGISHITLWAEH